MYRRTAALFALILTTVSPPSAGQPGERYYSGLGTVTCESRNGGYRECYTGYRAPPALIQRLSDSPCREGQSWGHRPGMVWVSDGCRAVFEEARGWGGGGGDRTIVCESRGGRYKECPAGFRGSVELVRQISGDPCIEGRTWGQTRGAIWVDRGCRGEFREYYSWGGGNWGEGTGHAVVCESRDGRYQRCAWDWDRGVPFLLEQYSSSPCVRGRSWGYDRQRGDLWVNEGCRGLFGSR